MPRRCDRWIADAHTGGTQDRQRDLPVRESEVANTVPRAPRFRTIQVSPKDLAPCRSRKSYPARIRAMRQNQRIIRRDACYPPFAWDVYRQPIQVATPA